MTIRTAALALLAAGVLFATPALAGKTTESGRTWSAYRATDEHAIVDPADVVPIYDAALKFYRPPRNQSRWLDLRLLPATAEGRVDQTLDGEVATVLVNQLGPRFYVLGEKGEPHDGAELQVSSIYASSANRVRVVVACRLRQGGSVTDNGEQSLSLVRAGKKWEIEDRGGVVAAK